MFFVACSGMVSLGANVQVYCRFHILFAVPFGTLQYTAVSYVVQDSWHVGVLYSVLSYAIGLYCSSPHYTLAR